MNPTSVSQADGAVLDLSAKINAALRGTVTPTVGVHPSLSFPDYHSWNAASNSRLSVLRRSPAHLLAYMQEPVDTGTLQLGRACHSAILEPDDFTKRYVLAERCGATKKTDGKRCSNMGIVVDGAQGWFCGVHASEGLSAPDVTILSPTDYERTLKVRDSVYAHRAAKLLPQSGQRELSIAWNDETTGQLCKARLDGHSPAIAGGVIVDIKTAKDASASVFERSIFSYGYHRQGALYLEGAKACGFAAEHFAIIAVEKEPPHAVAVYRLTEGALDAGAEQIRPLLARYAECVEKNEWPGYPDEVQDIALPSWAWAQIDAEVAA